MLEINKIHLGDCLDLMREIPDGSVDALVTDPPFGIGFNYSGKKEEASTPDKYWAWFGPHYREALAKVKPGGFVAVWQAQLNFPYFWKWFGDQIHIYAACKNFIQIRKTPINYGYDPVVMFFKHGADPLKPQKPKRSIDFFVANTAKWVAQTWAIEKNHPCPRPIDQVEEILANFTIPGGLILDPFSGSGTTAVACLNTGRNFICIEKDPEYFAVSNNRFEKQRTLLVA